MTWEWLVRIVTENWRSFLLGAGVTLLVSITGTILGSFIGLLIGTIRTIPMPDKGVKRICLKVVNALLTAYVEFFRGTPMIVQAMVIYYGSAQALGINMNPFGAALLIVSINTGAYTAEIVRGGIISIDKGSLKQLMPLV